MTSVATRRWDAWLRWLDQLAKPPCFQTDQQWVEWVAAAGDTSLKHKGPLLVNFCADCLPEYQQKMLQQNRCVRKQLHFAKVGPGAAFEGRKKR